MPDTTSARLDFAYSPETLMQGSRPPEVANESHLPLVLCLDTSGSMRGCIGNLNAAVKRFKNQVMLDPDARKRVDVAMITFGNGGVKCVQSFVPLEHMNTPTLTSDGATPLGEALDMAFDALSQRRREYDQNGTPVHVPWIVVITDGYPVGPNAVTRYDEAKARLRARSDLDRLRIVVVGAPGYDRQKAVDLAGKA